MRSNTLLTWGLGTLMALSFAMPVFAVDIIKGEIDIKDGRARVRVVAENDTQEQTQAYQHWYGAQMRGFRDIDAESGQPISDLVQLVDDVNNDNLWIIDQQNTRRQIRVTDRTEFKLAGMRHGIGTLNGPRGNRSLQTIVNPGDLVIVQGILRGNGDLLATRIRTVGRAWGWDASDDDDNAGAPDTSNAYGYRYWGKVGVVNALAGWCEVNTGAGIRRVSIDNDCEILAGGHQVPIDFIRRGNRLVFYADADDNRNINAYRVVVLKLDESYPDGDRAYRFDPDRHSRRYAEWANPNKLPVIDGELDYVKTGLYFHKLVLRVDGRPREIFIPKSLQIIRGRERTTLTELRNGERLHIYYQEIDGKYFVRRAEVREGREGRR